MASVTGTIVEGIAINFLQQQQVQILHKNFSCKIGEIDIIAQDQVDLIFIEVRFRKSAAYGSAAESIDWRKQQKILQTAQFYLQKFGAASNHIQCRFDVVAISNSVQTPHIEWIKDAFHA